MRTTLLGLVLIAAAGITLFQTAVFFGFAKQEPVDSRPLHIAASVHAVDTALSPSRIAISKTELSIAIANQLLPPETKSLLKVPSQLRHGEYVWNELGVPTGSIVIWVDLRRQMISAFRNGHEIGTAVIVYGAQDMTSPEGVFKILKKRIDYHSVTYDAPMPYSMFITNDGVALHGSPMSNRRASHGCIGLPDEFAAKLFQAAKVGDVVTITTSHTKLVV